MKRVLMNSEDQMAVNHCCQLDLSGKCKSGLVSVIEKIDKSGLQQLDISCNNLLSLPPEIETLHNLEKLNISRNSLGFFLNSTSARMPLNIKYLQMTHCAFTSVPPIISTLPHLISLDISCNCIKLLPTTFPSTLQSLNLSINQIHQLPPTMCTPFLRFLDVSYNKLNSIPVQVGEMVQLKELVLIGNDLTTVPRSIGKCTALERLNLDQNRLSMLPVEIGKLHSKLKLITLCQNPLLKTEADRSKTEDCPFEVGVPSLTLLCGKEIVSGRIEHISEKIPKELMTVVSWLWARKCCCYLCGNLYFGNTYDILLGKIDIGGIEEVPIGFYSCKKCQKFCVV